MHLKIFFKTFIILLCIFCYTNSKAQIRNEFWARLNVTKEINKHFAIGLDIQHRRQADFYQHDKSIFHYGLTNGLGLYAYYKITKDWKLIASPFAYFDNLNIINSYREIFHSHELRSMLGLSKSIIIGKTRNTNRFLYEYTFVEKEESKYIIRQRFRLQNKLLFPVKKFNNANQLNYILFNEIFFKKQNKQISFDQSRFYNGIQWSARQTTLSIGYQYVYQITAIGAVNKNQWLLLLDANFWRSY